MPRANDENQRIKDERREKIIKAATCVFARKGPGATKISDIAEAADMSLGLIYHYFNSKDELFSFLVHRAVTGALEVLDMVLDQPLSAWEKLEAITGLILKGLEEDPQTFTLVGRAMANEATSPEVLEAIKHQSDRYAVALRELLVQGQADGTVVKGDLEDLMKLYFLCLQGLAVELTAYSHLNPRMIKPETMLSIFKA